MNKKNTIWQSVLQLNKDNEFLFNDIALEIFHYQYTNCIIYRAYCDLLQIQPESVNHFTKIPFLPISFFKTHKVLSSEIEQPQIVFESSGTTQTIDSHHYIAYKDIYITSCLNTFKLFYGTPEQYVFLCLLPNYLEKGNSSLVYMCDHLIRASHNEHSGFYLDEWYNLSSMLKQDFRGKKKFLIGVTYALIDFSMQYKVDLKETIVMETGGMKGRKTESTRQAIHNILKSNFKTDAIHSEYGMTELLSQAYSTANGIFRTPPQLKILIRDEYDPFTIQQEGRGLINIIDLANIYSCSFIATDDVGRLYSNGKFEVLGRKDRSDLRGCSLLSI